MFPQAPLDFHYRKNITDFFSYYRMSYRELFGMQGAIKHAGAVVNAVKRGSSDRLPLARATYRAADTLRKSDGDMPASLRNDLLKALSDPKPLSMATLITLAFSFISSACA
jgi:hypothetical protein